MNGTALRARMVGTGAVAVIIGLTTGCKDHGAAQAGSATYIVVSPADLHGWELVTNQKGGFPYQHTANPASTATYRFRNGPGRPPAGTGSLQMNAGNKPNSLVAALAPGLDGSRLRSLTSVSYSTYVTKVGSSGAPLPISFNIAIASAKSSRLFTLVFDPWKQSSPAPEAARWQTWEPLAGKWWATGVSSGARCSQQRTCSWRALKRRFGRRGIIDDAYFELGSSGSTFVGAACALDKVIINGTAYDLEKHPPASPPKVPVTGLRPLIRGDKLGG